MGMSTEINGNNCFLTANAIHLSANGINCGETLVFNQNSVQNMPQLVTGLELNSINAFNNTFNALDVNNSLIINTNELSSVETSAQQILLVSSPMDLMAVSPQPLIAKSSAQQTTAVQMVLQTTDIPLIQTATQLNVIQVPTNLLLTDNNLIVIPQEGITLEVPAIDTNATQQTINNQINYENKSQTLLYTGSPQLIGLQSFNSNLNSDQLIVNLNDCIAINKSIDDNSDENQYFQSSPQIISIIDGNIEEPKLITSDLNACTNDLNAFLASSLSPIVEQECDPNEAKSWLNDSLIAYRAMIAFKKVMPNDTPSPTSGIQIRVNK